MPCCDQTNTIAEGHQGTASEAGESGSTFGCVREYSLLTRSYLFLREWVGVWFGVLSGALGGAGSEIYVQSEIPTNVFFPLTN
jgi:hypothetical protein